MPQPHTLKITEIFSSLQGEGLRQGEPTLFIRLSGCNLRCSFCDTSYAWKSGKEMHVSDCVNNIKKLYQDFPAKWICVTGGEPLLQDISELARCLKKEKFKIQVETNATLFQPLPVDWFTISPKPPKYDFHPEYIAKAKEVKIVLTRGLDFETVRQIRNKFPKKTPLLLQPQSNKKWSVDLGIKITKEAMRAELSNIKISCQLHKIFGLK